MKVNRFCLEYSGLERGVTASRFYLPNNAFNFTASLVQCPCLTV